MGVPIQLKLRAPDLSYPTQTGISVKVYILSNTGCILREEDFSNRDITEGSLTLMLGSGIPNSLPAGGETLTLNQTVIGEVTVNGSQAIEIHWNSSAGTATSVGARMMMINRIR